MTAADDTDIAFQIITFLYHTQKAHTTSTFMLIIKVSYRICNVDREQCDL